MKNHWVLEDKNGEGYYTGKSYQHQRLRFAVCSKDNTEAKKYYSKSRAERARDTLGFENVTLQLVYVSYLS